MMDGGEESFDLVVRELGEAGAAEGHGAFLSPAPQGSKGGGSVLGSSPVSPQKFHIHALLAALVAPVALVGLMGPLSGCAIDSSATLPPELADSATADARMGDAGDAAPADSGSPRDSTVPPPPPRDSGADADGGFDAGVDSGPDDPRCPASADGVVALYTFAGVDGVASVPDVVGGHDGQVQNGTASVWSGPRGCGEAFRMPSATTRYVAVPDSEAWDLPEGSADFWFIRLSGAPTRAGLLARDAFGTSEPGHMRVVIEGDGRLLFRIQNAGTTELYASPPAPGAWHHVGVNWGAAGLELWFDGVMADSNPEARSIDGNDNPWVIGADLWNGVDGSFPPERVNSISTNTGIDHVRISSVRRDFSSYAALAPATP